MSSLSAGITPGSSVTSNPTAESEKSIDGFSTNWRESRPAAMFHPSGGYI